MFTPRLSIKPVASPSGCSFPAMNLAFVLVATLGANDARADRIKASAAPPVFLWTDESQYSAQQVATSLTDDFGIIRPFSRGLFIGGTISPRTSINVFSWKEKADKNGERFASTDGVRTSRSKSKSGSSSEDSAGASAGQISSWGTIGGHAGGGAALTAISILGHISISDDPDPMPLLGNPIPTAFILFASGLAGLGMLAWRRHRKAQAQPEFQYLLRPLAA